MALLKPIAYLGLALTLLPCVFLYLGVISAEFMKTLMLVGSLTWLVGYGLYQAKFGTAG